MIDMILSKDISQAESVILSVSLGKKDEQSGFAFTTMVDATIKSVNPAVVKTFALLNTVEIFKLNQYAHLLWRAPLESKVDLKQIQIDGDVLAEEEWKAWNQENAVAIKRLQDTYKEKFQIISLPTPRIEDLSDLNTFSGNKASPEYKMLLEIKDFFKHDRQFKHAVVQLANNFFSKNFSGAIDLGSNTQSSRKSEILTWYKEYIIRESAARVLMPFDYEIYRGSLNIPATLVQHKYHELCKGKMELVSIGGQLEVEKAVKQMHLFAGIAPKAISVLETDEKATSEGNESSQVTSSINGNNNLVVNIFLDSRYMATCSTKLSGTYVDSICSFIQTCIHRLNKQPVSKKNHSSGGVAAKMPTVAMVGDEEKGEVPPEPSRGFICTML